MAYDMNRVNAAGMDETLDTAIPAGRVVADGAAAEADGAPIGNVLFDFGNVLVVWDPRAALATRYRDEAIDAFLDNARSGFTDAIAITDGGGTIAQARAFLADTKGHPWVDMYDYYSAHFIDTMVATVPGALRLVADLKAAGIGVWGVSNWGAEDFQVARRLFPVFTLLDGYVVSGEVKTVKPGPDIFRRAFDEFGVNPASCVFVDDRGSNVKGANAVGVRAIRFDGDMRLLRRTLAEAGVPIPGGDLPAGPAARI